MKIKVLVMAISLAFVFGCKGGEMKDLKADLSELKNIPQEQWGKLANKKIYFGHQSVGYDIIDGINDIIREFPNINLNVKKTKDANDFDNPIFAHSGVGQNKDPLFKCNDFKKNIESGIGDKVDIAFFKYCWADVQKDTEVEQILEYYFDATSFLETKYPDVRFIYVTIPLMVPQSPLSLKGIVKRMLGRTYLGQEEENIKRSRFNELLREKCKDKILFDLENIETTYPDGERYIVKRGNLRYLSLIPEYTDDGGHPNELSRKIIAKELLKLIVSNMDK